MKIDTVIKVLFGFPQLCRFQGLVMLSSLQVVALKEGVRWLHIPVGILSFALGNRGWYLSSLTRLMNMDETGQLQL